MEDMIRAIAALLVVLAAILGLGYALRRFSAGRINAEGRASDLRVLEWRGLDARRKLVVVRWDDREHQSTSNSERRAHQGIVHWLECSPPHVLPSPPSSP